LAETLIAILALVLLTIGSWLAWTPAGLLVPGALLLAGVVWKRMGSIPKAERTEEAE
jgi:hypothetical protein